MHLQKIRSGMDGQLCADIQQEQQQNAGHAEEDDPEFLFRWHFFRMAEQSVLARRHIKQNAEQDSHQDRGDIDQPMRKRAVIHFDGGDLTAGVFDILIAFDIAAYDHADKCDSHAQEEAYLKYSV